MRDDDDEVKLKWWGGRCRCFCDGWGRVVVVDDGGDDDG